MMKTIRWTLMLGGALGLMIYATKQSPLPDGQSIVDVFPITGWAIVKVAIAFVVIILPMMMVRNKKDYEDLKHERVSVEEAQARSKSLDRAWEVMIILALIFGFLAWGMPQLWSLQQVP